jgi:hypothetical protein
MLHFFRSQYDIGSTVVFLHSPQIGRAGNGGNPGLLVDHPGKGNLGRSCLPAVSQRLDQGQPLLVLSDYLFLELGHDAAFGLP